MFTVKVSISEVKQYYVSDDLNKRIICVQLLLKFLLALNNKC